MAKEVSVEKKLEELLKCSICLDSYTNPRILQCSHICCQDCLVKIIVRGQGGQRSILCPICRQITPLPVRGVTGFQSVHFLVNDLKEIQHALCPDKNASYCSLHDRRKSELYCGTCEVLICHKCAYKGGEHHDHDHRDLEAALRYFKETVKPGIQSAGDTTRTVLRAVKKMVSRTDVLWDDESVMYRHTILKDISAELKAQKARINALLKLSKKHLDGIEMLKRRVLEQVEQATATLQSVFSKLEKPDPSKCYVTGKVVMAKENATTILHAVNFRNNPCTERVEALKVEATNLTDTKHVACSVERRGESQYAISYWSYFEGTHKLCVKINGVHIRGSPFAMETTPQVNRTPLFCETWKLRRPYGIASKGRWSVIVTEEAKHCVTFVVWPLFGRTRSFGSYGSGEGQFDSPRGVALDGRGNILVADHGNHRIQKFTATGEFLAAAGSLGSGPLKFNHPTGIAFNGTNNTVYVVDANHCVQGLTCLFKKAGFAFSCIFGGYGKNIGQLDSPSGIACDSTGEVYVADGGNCRIQCFTADGVFTRWLAILGGGSGEVGVPISIAIDDCDDMLYVSECGRVSVFTPYGERIKSLVPDRDKIFTNPRGLAMDGGAVHLCDNDHIYGDYLEFFRPWFGGILVLFWCIFGDSDSFTYVLTLLILMLHYWLFP